MENGEVAKVIQKSPQYKAIITGRIRMISVKNVSNSSVFLGNYKAVLVRGNPNKDNSLTVTYKAIRQNSYKKDDEATIRKIKNMMGNKAKKKATAQKFLEQNITEKYNIEMPISRYDDCDANNCIYWKLNSCRNKEATIQDFKNIISRNSGNCVVCSITDGENSKMGKIYLSMWSHTSNELSKNGREKEASEIMKEINRRIEGITIQESENSRYNKLQK